ncbi:MAG: hypothetical protein KGV58_00785 [Campylobacteraceae bacterium]|nr:hypothetical protein [Campylobacteraceae bacterium]MBS9778825.1 hypothetical protein [Campylobacteraceae bacterium]
MLKALTMLLHVGFIFTATLVADKLHVENLHAKTLTLSQPTQIPLKDTNLTLHVKDDNGKTIKKDITWIVKPLYTIRQNGTNVIVPLKDTNIKLKAKYKGIISNEINLHVKWIVNGHTLPQMPDEKINNSTLLGVDINNNGVRDDVERWIYKEYKNLHPIHIDIAMQAARGYKKVLEMPERALEIRNIVVAPIFCEHYYSSDATEYNEPILIRYGEDIDSKVKNKYFNTKKRYRIYLEEYDRRLSGHTFTLPWSDEMKKYCNFDTSKYDKDIK